MRDETVLRVTNSRYHANLSSDRVFLPPPINDSRLQRITTAKLNVLDATPFPFTDPLWSSSGSALINLYFSSFSVPA
jgi:hypothetical protein